MTVFDMHQRLIAEFGPGGLLSTDSVRIRLPSGETETVPSNCVMGVGSQIRFPRLEEFHIDRPGIVVEIKYSSL